MKLEFERFAIAEALYEELGFARFLDLFDRQLPILPSLILRPLTTAEGEAHFAALGALEDRLDRDLVAQLLDLGRDLPRLDTLLPGLESGQLEQYHLFELGRFLQADRFLHGLESGLGIALDRHPGLETMRAILAQRTSSSFALIALPARAERLRQAIEQAEIELAEALNRYEQRIFARTGLKMTYPWPKEIALSPDLLAPIRQCELLTVQPANDLWRLDFRPGAEIEALVSRRDSLSTEFAALMGEALAALNRELAPLSPAFAAHYQARKQRIFSYLLIAVKIENGLCFPRLTPQPGCRLEQAWLHPLRLRKGARCVPLDLSLSEGASVLYGANMSGKTTVLKTAFFLFSLIRFGLPAPAREIEMHFPEHVLLMLKSSGNIARDISTFGEEVAFFSQAIPDGAFVLADELFASTDPVNGVVLSRIFLSQFNRRHLIFFSTSHYPEVLEMTGIGLYRMRDIDAEALDEGIADLGTLQERMPYRLEKLPEPGRHARRQPDRTPLKIALLFPLPEAIRQQIREHLNQSLHDE